MRRAPTIAGIVACLGVAAGADDIASWEDAAGDAVVRRTDTGNNGALLASCVLPDVIGATLSGWQPELPIADPYSGSVAKGNEDRMLRLDVVFQGLVNPPGTVGLAGHPFAPGEFGPSPVYGFLDIDVDGKNTGGELGAAATLRYLYNVGRFGAIPYGSLGERAARWSDDHDGNFFKGPQFERTGAEFALVLCGCWPVTIVEENGDLDGEFEAGETWVVRGRFLQRAGGYSGLSSAFGGSVFGAYDPWCNLRFSHDAQLDRTTLTMVFPLGMPAAAALAGQPEQPSDYNVANHTSIVEALEDIIEGAAGPLPGELGVLAGDWKGEDAYDHLDPADYEVTALFGTTYAQQEDAVFVWTDAGFRERRGDFNSDGMIGKPDYASISDAVAMYDGSSRDADGIVNGSITIVNPGPGFAAYDIDGDGVIDSADLAFCCPPDIEGDGDLDLFDFLAFQGLFADGDPRADFEGDGDLDIFDFLAYQDAFLAGC